MIKKVIKIVIILVVILFVLILLGGLFGKIPFASKLLAKIPFLEDFINERNVIGEEVTYNFSETVDSLDISIGAAGLRIEKGDELKVVTNLKDIKVEEVGGTLQIIEDKNILKTYSDKIVLTVYVPEGKTFNRVNIESGAGTVYLQEVNADNADFSLGAGAVTIEKLNISDYAKINGGAGKISIVDGILKSLKVDLKAGQLDFSAKVESGAYFNCTTGVSKIALLGSISDYSVSVSKGIGKITVFGAEVENGDVIGEGNTKINISGGVGQITVEYSV